MPIASYPAGDWFSLRCPLLAAQAGRCLRRVERQDLVPDPQVAHALVARAEVEAQETAENTEPEAAPAEDEEIEEEPIQLRGETKTCPVCKAEVDGDALFCNHCGAQL